MADIKLFIVEGEARDLRFIELMSERFLKNKHDYRIIHLPAKQNIFMLYDILKDDDFETDIVEVLRDNVDGAAEILNGCLRKEIAEVYLFFDYDIQQLSEIAYERDIMSKLFEVFQDETENGKLYISYPMVEAIYDYKEERCDSFNKCFVDISEIIHYKESSGKNNPAASKHFKYEDWEYVLETFGMRAKCLFDNVDMDYSTYKNDAYPEQIYNKQSMIVKNRNAVFVLSAFPEFLFDYFKIDFWKKYIRRKSFSFDVCEKLR